MQKTNEQFLKELKRLNKTIIPEEPYINAKTKIKCHCERCNHTWSATPNKLLGGSGCPNCAGNIKRTNADFLLELSKKHPQIEPLEKYINSNTAIKCRCNKCGKVWAVTPTNLLKSKYGCPTCAIVENSISRRMTNDEFLKRLSIAKPNIIPLEPYIDSTHKIKCLCKKCQKVWASYPNNLLSKKTGCPKCSNAESSVIEQIIFESFCTILGKSAVKSRDRKAIKKELDVYIPCLKLAVEYGAWVWHKDKIENDNEKQRLCANKGIHLITIIEKCPYKICDNYIGDYRIFQNNLSAEKDYKTTQELLNKIFAEYNLSFDLVKSKWDIIVSKAIKNAQRRNENDFKLLLKKVNPDITVIDSYTKADGRVHCKCNICDHEWTPYASSLLSAHGCPECAKKRNGLKRRLTNEEFIRKLNNIHKNIEPLEQYIKSDIKIQFKCNECGNIWPAKPANLLSGKGCPKCAAKRTNESRKRAVRCIETGIVYSSIAEAAEKTGTFNIFKCINGKQSTAGGYHWKYENNADK